MSRWHIHGAVDPITQRPKDLYLDAGRIVSTDAPPAGFHEARRYDAQGQWLLPGLVDSFARLGQVGAKHVETLTHTATSAGVSTLLLSPQSRPCIDDDASVELLRRIVKQSAQCWVHPLGALTRDLSGETLAEMAKLNALGCVGFSQADQALPTPLALRRALEYAATFDLLVVLQPTEATLADGCIVHDGADAVRMGLPGLPYSAETIALASVLELARETGVRLHFSRLSSARGVAMVARAKDEGVDVTADVAIAQLYGDTSWLQGFAHEALCWPPLRSETDREALRGALAEGVIDGLSSNHCDTDGAALLAPMAESALGMSTLAWLPTLAFALDIPRERILDALTKAPRARFGLPSVDLEVGQSADLCLFDPHAAVTLPRPWSSASAATPGRGQVSACWVDGEQRFVRQS